MIQKGENPSRVASVETECDASKLPQYLGALTVSLGAFGQGTVLAWTSPAGPHLLSGTVGFPVSQTQFSWIGSLMTLGAAAMVIPMGFLIDKLGRKTAMLLMVLPYTVGWALLIWGNSVAMLYCGRFLTGMAGGAFSVAGPVYTTEISRKEIRGALGTYYQILLVTGVLYTYVVGALLSLFWMSVLCAVVPLIFAATFCWFPETPVYYLQKGQPERARRSLQWYRGHHYDVESELKQMFASLEEQRASTRSLRELFGTSVVLHGLLVSLGLMFFQQASGVNTITFYTTVIFKEAGIAMDAAIATIIVGFMQVVATFGSSLVVDRWGRRALLLLSDGVMAACCFTMGSFFFLKNRGDDVTDLGWLPVTSMSVFYVAYSLGFGPIPWMMMGELFALNIRGPASALACLTNWLLAFAVTKFFSDLVKAFGTHSTYWAFGVLSVLGTVFVEFLVPETKGKRLEDIQRELGGAQGCTEERQ